MSEMWVSEDTYGYDGNGLPPDRIMFTCERCDTVSYVPLRRAKRIIRSNGLTGRCECEACGGEIDVFDSWCRHCGASLEGGWHDSDG